jgi:L-seryl-tRNA(Ser) seleniumtransferase
MTDRRTIPSIDELRKGTNVRALEARFGARATVDALRAAASRIRRESDVSAGEHVSLAARIEAEAAADLARAFRGALEPVINATGVVIHTNLGRAPLADAAVAHVARVAGAYSALEYDVASGGRGRRGGHAESLLCRVTGAEAAAVVNNNAAATILILAALARGREVVVSRGELVEIGGGFRVPDIMRESGALLREVGTTNKTRASDYAAAIGGRTALILRVHPSNFRIEGFAERPALTEVVAVGRELGVPVVEDLGSGLLATPSPEDIGPAAYHALRDEPSAAASLDAGVDACCFSGDKLLGGPQAGVIVGRSAIVDRVRVHPLMRAFRADKLTYAALESTLVEHAAGRGRDNIPVLRMISASAESLRDRARRLGDALRQIAGWRVDIVEGASTIGGGSAPGARMPTWIVVAAKDGLTADTLDQRLRELATPVIATIQDDRVRLDLRTVHPEQDVTLLHLLETI